MCLLCDARPRPRRVLLALIFTDQQLLYGWTGWTREGKGWGTWMKRAEMRGQRGLETGQVAVAKIGRRKDTSVTFQSNIPPVQTA